MPTVHDLRAVEGAEAELARRTLTHTGKIPLLPTEAIPTARPSPNARGLSGVTRAGMSTFADLFATRQLLALTTFVRLIQEAAQYLSAICNDGLPAALQTLLAFGLSTCW